MAYRKSFMKFVSRFSENYRRGMERTHIYPMTSTGSLMLMSDVCAQLVVDGEDYDLVRTLRFGFFGFAISGPFNVWRFRLLDRFIKDPNFVGSLKKVLLDQIIVPPVFTAMLFTYLGVAKQLSWDDIVLSFETDCYEVTINSYKVFPIVSIICFGILPRHHRIVFMNSIAMIWNVYVSHASSQHDHNHDSCLEKVE